MERMHEGGVRMDGRTEGDGGRKRKRRLARVSPARTFGRGHERSEAVGSGMKALLRGVSGLVAIVGSMALGQGCVSSRVSDLEAYQEVPMNQVVPYPSRDEMRKRAFDVVLVDRPGPGIDDATLRAARREVHRALERIATNAGALVIDGGREDAGSDGESSGEGRAADFALVTRIERIEYSSSWEKPFKFLWQSEADVAQKPGTCTHRVEIQLEIELVRQGDPTRGIPDRTERTFELRHAVAQENKDLDPACSIAPVTLGVLLETALDEALSCLDLPLGKRLAPRGHVVAHRKAPEADRHIYRITLGSAQGIEPGNVVEIRREQRSISPEGVETRSERVLALGKVSDQVSAQSSWVAIDPEKATDEILKGDVVRPMRSESLLSSLSGPNCSAILVEDPLE